MLILTRRIDEEIMVGDEVVIKVLGVQGNHIRLGFQAPKDVSVHRKEVYERIKTEKKNQATNQSHLDSFYSEKFAEA